MRDSRVMKSVIFDMDGVLVDSSMLYAKVIRNVLKTKGYDFSLDHVLERIIPHITKWIDALLPKNLETRNAILNELTERIKEETAKGSRDVKYQKNVERLLEEISQKYILFLITNSGSRLTENILKERGLRRFFRKIITADDGFATKEKAIEHLLKEFKLNKKDLIYIGDTRKDVLCAKSVGCRVIILYTPFSWDYGNHNGIKSAKPDMVVKSFDNLVRALKEE